MAIVLFYSTNLVTQVTHGYPLFRHPQTRDPILCVVFAVGYVNLLGGAGYVVWLASRWRGGVHGRLTGGGAHLG